MGFGAYSHQPCHITLCFLAGIFARRPPQHGFGVGAGIKLRRPGRRRGASERCRRAAAALAGSDRTSSAELAAATASQSQSEAMPDC